MLLVKGKFSRHPETVIEDLRSLPNFVGQRFDKITIDLEELCDAFTEHGQAKVVLYLTKHLRLRLTPKT